MPNDFCVAEMAEPVSSTDQTAASRSALLRHYQAIAQASCAMLAAAQSGDWVEVAQQEERCCALIATLKAAADAPLSTADDAVRMQLLRQILADDAQVRNQAEPWLEQIAPYISTQRMRSDEPNRD